MGDFSLVQPHATLYSLLVELSDGVERRTGPGSQAMGSPGEAVAWLVRSLADEGLVLRRGEIVFTGGLTAPFDAERGQTYSLTGAVGSGLYNCITYSADRSIVLRGGVESRLVVRICST